MDFPENIINSFTPDQIKLVAGISISIIVSAVGFMFAQMVKFAVGMRNDINHMKSNCLPTIQANTGKTAESLTEVIRELSEMNGYLKGRLD